MAKHKHGGWVISVRFSHDGTWVASGAADKWLRVFLAEAKEEVATQRPGDDENKMKPWKSKAPKKSHGW